MNVMSVCLSIQSMLSSCTNKVSYVGGRDGSEERKRGKEGGREGEEREEDGVDGEGYEMKERG